MRIEAKQKRTEVGQTETTSSPSPVPSLPDTVSSDKRTTIDEWLPYLTALENDLSAYQRNEIRPKSKKTKSSGPSRLNQQNVFHALLEILKSQAESGPGPDQKAHVNADVIAKIEYMDLLKQLANTNANDGKPLIEGIKYPTICHSETMPKIKPIVRRINALLKSKAGIEFKPKRGKAKTGHYDLILCSAIAPLPKSAHNVLHFAQEFCVGLAEKCLPQNTLTISLINASSKTLSIGEKLRIRLRSPLAGWLTLVIIAPDQSEYLIPLTTSHAFRVEAGVAYEFPDNVDPFVNWQMRGSTGQHIIMAFVSPSHERLLLAPELKVGIRHDRGVGIQARDAQQISAKDLAFAYMEFCVKPKRNDPRGGG